MTSIPVMILFYVLQRSLVGGLTGASNQNIDGDTILGTTTANAFGLWFLVSPPLAAGKNTIFAEATNASGVTGLLSAGLTIKV